MREIKFRCWDKEFTKMRVTGFSVNKGILSNDETCIIMQYTGLKDVHGKEIYEGDIIQKLYKGEPERSFPSYIIIEWGFHSDHSSYMYQLGWNLWEDEEYKVVGNIYENPELLTK